MDAGRVALRASSRESRGHPLLPCDGKFVARPGRHVAGANMQAVGSERANGGSHG
jgi:hypothetical protein